MLVQHFLLPSSTTTTVTNSSFSPSSPSSSLTKNKKTSILSPFFNSESTGFQPTTDENFRMGYGEKIKTHLSSWPRKLTSVMEIHRQGFSQLNPRFKQQQTGTTLIQPVQQSVICPVILPSASRPQPRQQARSKQYQQTYFPPAQSTRRSNTAHVKQQQLSSFESNNEYITLANLTKILHVLQTQDEINDHDTSTDTSTSTTNSAKQRVQQHLQETATRWWKPIRLSDGQLSVAASSSTHTYTRSAAPTKLLSSDVLQQQKRQESDNLPLLTIVSNSTRHLNIPPSNSNGTSKYDESESSTEIQTIISSIVQVPKSANIQRARQEPLIMQARGMHLRSHDYHYYYNNQNNMNFLQQQRLIRQT